MARGASSVECTCPYCKALSMVSAIEKNDNTHIAVRCDLCDGIYRVRNPRFTPASDEPVVGTPDQAPSEQRLANILKGDTNNMQDVFCDVFTGAAERLGEGGTQAVAVLIVRGDGNLYTEWAGVHGTRYALLGAMHSMAHRYAARLDAEALSDDED